VKSVIRLHNLLFLDQCILSFGATAPPPQWARSSSFTRFLDHTQRRTTVGRTSLDEGAAYRRDHYLTTHNTHTVGFEPTVSAGERPQTYALDCAATGTFKSMCLVVINLNWEGRYSLPIWSFGTISPFAYRYLR